MKQIASNSQTPDFAKNKSNTSPVLYQHPKKSEIGLNRFAQFKADAKDFALFIVFAICAWFFISLLLTTVFGG